jgi:hypothetical protein
MTTFDPNSITPSEELLEACISSPGSIGRDCTLAARWGAAQAAKALRHQWPEPITDRPPTEEDGDERGFVQFLINGAWWGFCCWENAAKDQRPAWLHTPDWRPKPEPTLKQQALEILFWDSAKIEITHEQVLTLRAALAQIPEDAG